MGHNPSCPLTSEDGEAQSGPHSTRLEVPGMAPSTLNPWLVQGFDNPPDVRNSSSHQGAQSSAGYPTYIQKSCEERHLTQEATDLLMASWWARSQSNYNSLFYKWEGWCHKQDRNPIQGPVTDVINFLAQLHEARYRYMYRSLNSYCSAISLVHEKADGHLTGHHQWWLEYWKKPSTADHLR